jgi:P27 family predicted phage terminase small subunit
MPQPRKLRVVEELEGGIGHRPIERGMRLPPEAPAEPSWLEWFPPVKVPKAPAKPPAGPGRLRKGATDEEIAAHSQAKLAHLLEVFAYRAAVRARQEALQLRAEAARCRTIAKAAWRAVVPVLDQQGILATIDAEALTDYAVLVARKDQAERDISRRGLNVEGERGLVKNPSVSALNGIRSALRDLRTKLGLTPLDRDRINPREGGGDEGDWA